MGLGDAASGGFTRWIRKQSWYGGDTFTDQCSGAYQFGGFAGDVASAFVPIPLGKVRLLAKIEQHHMIPRAVKEFAERTGLNIDDYIKLIPAGKHRYVAEAGIHTVQSGVSYHAAWKAYAEHYPDASRSQILRFMRQMEKKYNLTQYPWK